MYPEGAESEELENYGIVSGMIESCGGFSNESAYDAREN
jgi:hypothetical protein